MAITWSSIFKNKPAGGDAPSTLDNQQRVHREAVEERAENEHDTFEDGTSGLASKDWRHKEGSARVYYQSGEPSNQPGANGAVLGTDDAGRIWIDSDNSNNMKVWNGSSFDLLHPLLTKVIDIGDWDMDSSASVTISHGIGDPTKIRTVLMFIHGDVGAGVEDGLFPMARTNIADGTVAGLCELYATDNTKILGQRVAGGFFDSASLFKNTPFNRGWIIIQYEG